jgi:hypothetical protein
MFLRYYMHTILAIMIIVSLFSCAPKKVLLREADEPVIVRSRQFKPFLVDSQKVFLVRDEGKIVLDFEGRSLNVASDVVQNNDTLHTIRFAKAALDQDTLRITLHELNESSDAFYKMIIVGGKYFAQYDFSTPMDRKNRTIKPLETALILNTAKFEKGATISGHVEFCGKCNRECWQNPIRLSGNFRVRID